MYTVYTAVDGRQDSVGKASLCKENGVRKDRSIAARASEPDYIILLCQCVSVQVYRTKPSSAVKRTVRSPMSLYIGSGGGIRHWPT